MNRAERRAESRRLSHEANMYARFITERNAAENARNAKLERNGITVKDLEREYKRGRTEVLNDASDFAIKMIYCGFALALKREFGFGRERILKAIKAADWIIAEEFTTEDIIDRVSRELGIEIRFECEKGGELFDV